MESELLLRARNLLQVAEQVLLRTYPLVNDPKLLLGVAQDIHAALKSAMKAVLEKEGISKDGFDAEFDALKGIAGRFRLSADELEVIGTMHTIIAAHEASPVEFPRHDCFVICDEKYDMMTITVDNMKSFLFRAGLFVEKVEDVFRAK
ncbi:hypothetical protein KY363_05300 [Candidatus Woesearchaeota archaeon]|nr:hypothetical protein [Candidatus Woesearchaeota archaeon]